jgi:signal transduction histidine kinase
MARSLQKTLENKNATEAEVAGELVQVVKDAHDHVRAMIKGVRPVDVQAGGLLAALTDLAAATERLAGLPCDFECRQLFALEDDHAATQLFYIAQEAVRNSVKHARAKHITIGFGREDRRLRLWVHDDGRGLPAGSDRTDGMGFRIVRYRAALIGATLAIEPAHGGGTLVTCTLPLEQLR